MDSFDLNTRLPPRKRLLAGLRKESSDADISLPPLPPVSTGLYARLRDLLDSATSSPDDIVEASMSAALAADEVAARARAVATEKAAAAAKARAAAKSALELLDSVTGRRDLIREGGQVAKGRAKKKHVPVKLLYKNKQRGEVHRTDEEVARRLHHTMNSSQRISGNSHKKRRKTAVSGDSAVRTENSAVVREGEDRLINGYCADGMREKVVLDRGSVGIKKVKGRPKRVLLSQCNMRNQGKPGDEALGKGPKLDSAQRNSPLDHTKPSDGGEVPMKISSVLKCKKFKVPPRSSSDCKISHSLGSDPAAPKATEMVKVD